MASTNDSALSNIQNVIVLMFENRSFDHILGAMPGVNGVLSKSGVVNPALYNTMYPTQPESSSNPSTTPFAIRPTLNNSKTISNTPPESQYVTHDFNHDFGDGMLQDIFGPGTTGFIQGQPQGAPTTTYPSANSGFLSTQLGPGQQPAPNEPPINGAGALSYFQWQSMEVFHTLAESFVVCDAWHCDMPGHTSPNRAFMHCGTTGDLGINDDDRVGTANMVNRTTIFERIQENSKTWKMYWPGSNCDTDWLNEQVFSQQWSTSDPTAQNVTHVPISQFFKDLSGNTLPFYSFIMCWNDIGFDTSMHPASQVEPGEELLACVYNAFKQSPYWENTLLIVNFDENGGIYDHASVGTSILPKTVAPDFDPNSGQEAPPVSKWTSPTTGKTYSFDFTALGVRIPVLLISPWLNAGICSNQYQNTSILRFLQDMLPNSTGEPYFLTQRDKQAPSIASVFEQLGSKALRTDCPNHICGYAQGICKAMQNDDAPPTAEELAAPLPPHLAKMTKEYIAALPGHPDSGKPVTRNFSTVGEMRAYAKERRDAALAYIGAKQAKT